MSRRPWTLLLLGALLLPGCSFSDDEPTQRVVRPALVTKAHVDRYPPGSPARAFFEWWRSMQFDNPIVAARYYSRQLGLTPQKLETQLRLGSGALHLNQRPKLLEVEQDGDTAIVFALLEGSTRNPNGRIDVSRNARSFNLVREDGDWKLSDNMFIERGVRTSRVFLKAVERAQRENRGR
jgi:hypothetical protein